MAANDYYNNSGPRPAQPSYSNPPYDISPASSPFDDRNRYDYSSANLAGATSHHGDTSYHGPSSHSHPHQSSDPFADQNAIPLKQHHAPMPTHGVYAADPEGRRPSHAPLKKKKQKGWFSGRVTWVVYFMTTVQVAVFVGELIKNGILTGSPIQTKPNFNIMIGPSPFVLINMGARYVPCMHYIRTVVENKAMEWPCPNLTVLNDNKCDLNQLCGLGGVPKQDYNFSWEDRAAHKDKEPNQWYRFITPIFLHAGLIHIGFNMLLQWTLGRDMEKEIGSLRFALVYFSAGIFGFVLGGNYAAEGITSVGASGSLFGILALVLLDLLYNWNTRRSPVKDLMFLLLDFAISFVLGLLPGLDNFSHIGGFLMGLVLGICLLHSPPIIRARIASDPPYSSVSNAAGPAKGDNNVQKLLKEPVGFFKGRKPFWWAWWGVRAIALIMTLVGFILLLRNFYDFRNGCSWCRHLTCLPITTGGVNWCDMGNIAITNTTSSQAPGASATRAPQARAWIPAAATPVPLQAF
ncbi:rhomboid-domain-containing protein [Periconia macrospinosa]|uniref:Rhomboid-type serine protease n=1 Tax=Periconia macrospinosa TaxID=97972 RepID=A0A2V1E7H7_9PLEO|nr:rhomboid-domain-containing protein [Periconia macrospinosa]